jgi:lambda family phage portal protein
MLRLKDVDEYSDAQVIKQKIAACFAAFVQQDADGGNPALSTEKSDGIPTDHLQPGIITDLKPGQTVAFATPPQVDGYSDFVKSQLSGIALGYGMDYVTFTGDLKGTNFSSGRMGWLEFHRKVSEWQWKTFIPMFCEKSWEWFCQMAAIAGVIRAGQDIDVRWSTPRREMINPTEETQATIDSYQNGLTSWSDAVLELGNDPEEQVEKMKTDMTRFKEAGLPPYTDKTKMIGKDLLKNPLLPSPRLQKIN